MAQFDVYKNANKSTRSSYPYLVEVQADMLSELRTTIVIPLLAKKGHAGTQLNILHPEFDIYALSQTQIVHNMQYYLVR